MNSMKPDCSRHKKEVAGISDMKALAEMIGDLHYESLSKLFYFLAIKISNDSQKDLKAGRVILSQYLEDAATNIDEAEDNFRKCWRISKPFMNNKTDTK